jgi:hypothetical protein
LKALLEKLFQTPYYFSGRTSLRKTKNQNIIFLLYASLLAKGWFTKLFISLSKLSLKDNFKQYFIKCYPLILKGFNFKTLVLFMLCKQSPFAKFIKFYWKILFYFKNLFLTVPL